PGCWPAWAIVAPPFQLRAQVVDAQVERLGGGVEPGTVTVGGTVGLGRWTVAGGLGAGHGGRTEDGAAGEGGRHRGRGEDPRGPEPGAHEIPFGRGSVQRGSLGGTPEPHLNASYEFAQDLRCRP